VVSIDRARCADYTLKWLNNAEYIGQKVEHFLSKKIILCSTVLVITFYVTAPVSVLPMIDVYTNGRRIPLRSAFNARESYKRRKEGRMKREKVVIIGL